MAMKVWRTVNGFRSNFGFNKLYPGFYSTKKPKTLLQEWKVQLLASAMIKFSRSHFVPTIIKNKGYVCLPCEE